MKRLALFVWGLVLVMVLVACGGNASANNNDEAAAPAISGDPVAGEQEYLTTCSSCHGPDAKGLPALGKDLTTSTFFEGMDEEMFIEFVHTGRPASDPANTTGVDMPPKGGNPALTDEGIVNIRAYIYSLKQ